MRFRPELAVSDGDTAAGASPVAVSACIDPSNGREWVAVAWRTSAGEIRATLSGDGACVFAAGSGGFAPTAIAMGPAEAGPSIALRVDAGVPVLAVAWQQAGRILVRTSGALDGTFPPEVELDPAARQAPRLAIAPAPAPALLVAAWLDDVAGRTQAVVRSNPTPVNPATWTPALPLDSGVGADLGLNSELALSSDAAGTGGAAGFSVLVSAASGGAHVARSDDAASTFGAWRRIDDVTLLRPVGLAIAGAVLPGAASEAWKVVSLAGRTTAAPPTDRVLADAERHDSGGIAWDFDRVAGGPNVIVDGAASAGARTAAAVVGPAPGSSAFVFWDDGGEISATRRGLADAHPNLQGGCGPFRLSGIQPPRASGTAREPAAAALGEDVVVAWVDDRSGVPMAWLKRSDSVSPLPTGLVAAASACDQVPAVQLTWDAMPCDTASQAIEVGTSTGGTDFTRDPGAASSLLVEGLRPGTTYFLRVRATDTAGNVAVSAEVSADIPSCAAADLRCTLLGLADNCAFGGPGDANGAPDGGENVRLTIRVENVGTDVAVAPGFTVLSRSAELTVRSPPFTLPNMAVGAFMDLNVDVDISATAGCGADLLLLARARVATVYWADMFRLGVPAACNTCSSPACAMVADPSSSAPTTFCRGTDMILDGTASTGVQCAGALLFQWWNGTTFVSSQPAVTVTPTNSRTYRLIVTCSTDFDCTHEASLDVTVNQRPGISFSESPPPPHCEGDVVTLTASTPDPAATFAWGSGPTTPGITVTTSGVYTISVTDSNTCTNTASARVEFNVIPPAEAGPDVGACGGVPIGSPGYPLLDYSWAPPDGLSATDVPQPLASPLSATLYTLTVTDPTTGCSNQDQVLVTPAASPAAIANLRVSRAGGGLGFDWSADPLAIATRIYSELDVTLAGQASARSPSAVLQCAGGTTCSASLPSADLVLYQAVGVCADGVSEGPN